MSKANFITPAKKRAIERERIKKITPMPCPFCNCAGVSVIPAYIIGDFMVVCDECNASSSSEDSVEKAVAAWNKRPRENELVAEIERIARINDDIRAEINILLLPRAS
ncbi:MAG: Lar family restriction alleviation protein [Dehalococcoidia bacterium]|jgi:Lar family restriction alleviation protein